MNTSNHQRLTALQECARLLAQAANQQQWIDDPAHELMPQSLEEAYQIQDMAAPLRNDVPQGWKIGATSLSAQQFFDVSEPFAGRVFRNDIYRSPAVLSKVRADMLVVEGEFAFTMGAGLPPRPAPYSREEVVAAVAMLHPAIEYVQSRYRVRSKPNALKSVADNAGQGALILGPGMTDWQHLDLPRTGVRILAGDRELVSGTGAEVLGNPIVCLVWLANFLRQRGQGLKAGEVITTGTCTPPIEVPSNTPVLAQFDHLENVQLTFSIPNAQEDKG